MAKNAVIRTDLMHGTKNGDQLVSLRFYGADGKVAEVENGVIVELKGFEDGQREVMKAVAATADSNMADCAIIAAPEVMYDERKKNLDEYFNVAGKAVRGFMHHVNQYFSVTAEALDGTPAKDKFVEVQAGTKLKVADTEGAATYGKIVAVEQAGRYTYYVIQCK